jgi:F0F1-type ATP synthase assembly protein I
VEKPASMHAKAPGVVAGLGELGKSLAIGLDFLFTSAAGGAVGYVFDSWKGSFPVGTLIGTGIGFVAGTFRLILRLQREDQRSKGSRSSPSPRNR